MSRVCGLQPGPKFEVKPAAEKNSLPEKTYFRDPGISWKAQKGQVSFTFPSTFCLKKRPCFPSRKFQNKNFSVVSKYYIPVNVLAQKDRIFHPLKIQTMGPLAINKRYSTVKKILSRFF